MTTTANFKEFIKFEFEQILSKRTDNPDDEFIIHNALRIIANEKILNCDSGIFVFLNGDLTNDPKSFALNRCRSHVIYNNELKSTVKVLNKDFLEIYEKFMFSQMPNIFYGDVIKHLIQERVSNDILYDIKTSKNPFYHEVRKGLLELYIFYRIKKGIMTVHDLYNRKLNICCFYRSECNERDFLFTDEEMAYIKYVLPFIHIVSSIKKLELFALIDENNNESILVQGKEELLSIFNKKITNKFKARNVNSFLVVGKYGVNYKLISVRMTDLIGQTGSILGIIAINKDDYINNKYNNFYKAHGLGLIP